MHYSPQRKIKILNIPPFGAVDDSVVVKTALFNDSSLSINNFNLPNPNSILTDCTTADVIIDSHIVPPFTFSTDQPITIQNIVDQIRIAFGIEQLHLKDTMTDEFSIFDSAEAEERLSILNNTIIASIGVSMDKKTESKAQIIIYLDTPELVNEPFIKI